MKYLTLLFLVLSFNVYSQEQEGDLALPVTDLEIERQEEELPPTIDEVEVRQNEEEQSDHRGVRSGRTDGSEDTERKKY